MIVNPVDIGNHNTNFCCQCSKIALQSQSTQTHWLHFSSIKLTNWPSTSNQHHWLRQAILGCQLDTLFYRFTRAVLMAPVNWLRDVHLRPVDSLDPTWPCGLVVNRNCETILQNMQLVSPSRRHLTSVQPNFVNLIMNKFCTCHDSNAAMAYAKVVPWSHSDHH